MSKQLNDIANYIDELYQTGTLSGYARDNFIDLLRQAELEHGAEPDRRKIGPMRYKSILVLAPHTDDGELGAGGTMARFAAEGAKIHYCAFSKGSAIDREVLAAVRHVGVHQGGVILFNYMTRFFHERRQDILQDIITIRDRIHPELVLAPSPTDTHQDHQVVAAEAQRAFKETSLLGYELPWNNTTFSTRLFVRLEPAHVEAKWSALACYKSQNGRAYINRAFIYGLATTRGTQLGGGLAEAFEVVRWVI